MRRVLLSDAVHLATALSVQPEPDRPLILDLWIDQTRAAGKYLRRFGRPHPNWGDGSLTSRALLAKAFASEIPMAEGRDFLRTLSIVAHALSAIGQIRRQPLS